MSGALEGIRVLVLRPEHQAWRLAGELEAQGAVTVSVPAIKILPPADWSRIDDAVRRLSSFDWIIFTSVNGVESFLSRVGLAEGFPERVGAIGPATMQALVGAGVTVDWTPASFTSAALAAELPGPAAAVLLVRADIATTELEDSLRARGFVVERVDAYRTEPANAAAIREVLGRVDAVALTSASIARSFAQATAGVEADRRPVIASIGPATTAACVTAGLRVDVQATQHTIGGLVAALAAFLQQAATRG